MKHTVKFAKGVKIQISTRDASFEHPQAELKAVVVYDDLITPNADEDELERAAMLQANRIKNILSPFGEVTMPESEMFSGEVAVKVMLHEGTSPEAVQRRLESMLAVQSSAAARQSADTLSRIRQQRLDRVTLALKEYQGQSLDDSTIGTIAEKVLETLKPSKKGFGLK